MIFYFSQAQTKALTQLLQENESGLLALGSAGTHRLVAIRDIDGSTQEWGIDIYGHIEKIHTRKKGKP